MKIKTSELSGAALDWAVAKADGRSYWTRASARWDTDDGCTDWILDRDGVLKRFWFDGSRSRSGHWAEQERFTPSTDWSQGGPLYEKHDTLMEVVGQGDVWCAGPTVQPQFAANPHPCGARGPTKLAAFCRWFVMAHLGDEVDVPGELL